MEDEEFGWLMSDIESYNEHANETSVSLLESKGRELIKEDEDKQGGAQGQEGR